MKRCLFCTLLVLLSALPGAPGQEKKTPDTFLDPEKAGPEFAIQGEYVGTDGDQKFAAQVVALGGGKFDAYLLPGGLPGAGWDRKTRIKLGGVLSKAPDGSGVIAKFAGKEWSGEVSAGSPPKFRGNTPKGGEFALKQVVRKSPTEGAKPPDGALVLFDGTNVNEWSGGKIVEDKLLGPGPTTKKEFRDFKLHVEFRLPFRPASRGQSRGNSGVYIQRRYEIQILDSFGLDPKHDDCGSIYEQTAPAVNMCLPPLSWQTYDIDFTAARFDESGKKTANARVTVVHNGITIHDNAEIKGTTGLGRKEEDKPAPLYLQNHGNPVYFRNIWLVEKK